MPKPCISKSIESININQTIDRLIDRLIELSCDTGVCSLLVLDEMDSLDCKSQEVLYTMFEWPSLAKSKLILIGQ